LAAGQAFDGGVEDGECRREGRQPFDEPDHAGRRVPGFEQVLHIGPQFRKFRAHLFDICLQGRLILFVVVHLNPPHDPQTTARIAVTSTPSFSPSGTTEVIFHSPPEKLMRSRTLSASVSLLPRTRNVAGCEAESCAASRRSAPVPQMTPAQT